MEVTVIEELIGKTFKSVKKTENSYEIIDDWKGSTYGDGLVFLGEESFIFYHYQDCCENVVIEDIIGDLSDLENSPIIKAEERVSYDEGTENKDEWYDDHNTWTFYEFATIKGNVTVRWHGSSNGFYSESVDFARIKNANN